MHTSRIVLARSWHYFYGARKFRILCNDFELGRVSNGKTETFDVPDGEHLIGVRVDWSRTNLPVRLGHGESVELSCGIKGGLKAFSFKNSIFVENRSAQALGSFLPPNTGSSPLAGQPQIVDSAQQLSVAMRDDVERIPVHSESVRRRAGSRGTVSISRTVEHTVDLSSLSSGGMEVRLGIGPLSGSLRQEISNQIGRSFQSSETVQHQVEISGSAEIHWVDVWRHGTVTVETATGPQEFPIRFRERSELEVVDG